MAMCLFDTDGGVVPHIRKLEGGGSEAGLAAMERENSCFFLEFTPVPYDISHSTILLSGAIPATKLLGYFIVAV